MSARPAVRIDAHQHFWTYVPRDYAWIDDSMAALRRDFLPAHLEPELRRTGVDATIAVQVRQSLDENDSLLDLADRHAFVAGVVGWVDLQAAGVREQLARAAARPKFVGVRHIVQGEPDERFLLRPDFCRGIAVLGEFRLPYDILIYPRHLPVAIDFVARFPSQTFVLDHLAKPEIRGGAIDRWARDLERLAAHPQVFCKASGLVTEADWQSWTPEDIRPYLDVAFECFGVDRMIAGSDWPVCTVAADYSRTMAVVSDYVSRFTATERDAVLGGNALRVWFNRELADWGAGEVDRVRHRTPE